MADLTETPVFDPGIRQIETTDPVVGGPPNIGTGAGVANIPHLQLARRTLWLRDRVEGMGQELPLRGLTVFSTPGVYTWTVPDGVHRARVTVTGGGGSGARSADGQRGPGGSGGGTAIGLVSLMPGDDITVTVGAGGAGSSGLGNAGGTSSFGALMSATGGQGGGTVEGPAGGGNPGDATGGDINLKGGMGSDGANVQGSGDGGGSYWGASVRGGISVLGGSAPNITGGGTGGTTASGSGTIDGGNGIVLIEF